MFSAAITKDLQDVYKFTTIWLCLQQYIMSYRMFTCFMSICLCLQQYLMTCNLQQEKEKSAALEVKVKQLELQLLSKQRIGADLLEAVSPSFSYFSFPIPPIPPFCLLSHFSVTSEVKVKDQLEEQLFSKQRIWADFVKTMSKKSPYSEVGNIHKLTLGWILTGALSEMFKRHTLVKVLPTTYNVHQIHLFTAHAYNMHLSVESYMYEQTTTWFE